MKKMLLCSASALVLAACGGGGGGGTVSAPTPTPVTPTSTQYAQQCTADNPYRADADVVPKAGTLSIEKQWIKAYLDESYLWYDSMPAVDASLSAYSGSITSLDGRGVPLPLSNYFEALKTKLTTPSGKLTDQFSFTYPTKQWNQLQQSGVTAGYGIEWVAYNSYSPNRLWRVSMVQPGSPGALAGVLRGDTLKTVDGVDFANGSNTTALNAGLFPTLGSSHTLVLSRAGSADVTAAVKAAEITIDPVPVAAVVNDPAGHKVGYLHFTDHLAVSEAKLISSISTLKAANVTDLVLDLRYNGGGFLYLASELAYMIAGPTRTSNKIFDKLQYNAKRTTDNAQGATPFYDTSCILNAAGTNCTVTQPLPTLNLSRVFVIVSGDTCSASEAIINGLKGVDVDVQLIGSTTCGKPYGFSAKDNCGVSYFPIEFRGINDKGFGDFADGFSPTSGTATNTNLPGCAATDDLDHPLGNASERMLSSALYRAAYGSCQAASAVKLRSVELGGRLERSQARVGTVLLPKAR